MLDTLWILLCTGLVFLMQAGFMCLESGLTRSKNSINVAVKNIADFGLSVALFWALGYGVMFGSSWLGWLGTSDFLPNRDDGPQALLFLFQAMFCGTATTIISGALAERLKFTAYLAIAAWVSGLIYPLFGHWAWNAGGWLAQLGFHDFAGATVVHGVGAWVSLAALPIVGARRDRFSMDKANPIQGSNLPFSVLGCLLLWFGWIGFNGGSTLALNDQVPGIILNTMLGGVAGMITAAIWSWVQHHHVDVGFLINGSIAGLVAITAGCDSFETPIAVLVGATGSVVMLLIAQQLTRLKIDDAVDAVAVHGAAGAWGTLAVGLFGDITGTVTGNRLEQVGIQALGIGVSVLWAFGITCLVLTIVQRFVSLRVSEEDEVIGLNVAEHHARTETYDLLRVMDTQAQTLDLSLRVPVEPFTEVGHIATRYNQLMDNLEHNHRQNVDFLEEIYTLTTTVAVAVEHAAFSEAEMELAELATRDDDLGVLSQQLLQLLQAIQARDRALAQFQQGLHGAIAEQLRSRFPAQFTPEVEASLQNHHDPQALLRLYKQIQTGEPWGAIATQLLPSPSPTAGESGGS
ncbi:MAG: ammonium transporter [Cyanobacteria bacterium P01_G01_bin.54]